MRVSPWTGGMPIHVQWPVAVHATSVSRASIFSQQVKCRVASEGRALGEVCSTEGAADGDGDLHRGGCRWRWRSPPRGLRMEMAISTEGAADGRHPPIILVLTRLGSAQLDSARLGLA